MKRAHIVKNIFYHNSTNSLLLLLIILGSIFHFYNLNWGAPYYFHPDERNIASSVSQLRFPENMNPHFFAYGSLPIYAIFITGLLLSLFSTCQQFLTGCSMQFADAIIIGRFYSALFSTLLILLMFFVGKLLQSTRAGLLAAILTTFATGIIQYAHFATFEIWTTFFSVILFFFCLKLLQKNEKITLFFLAATTGILLSIKATNALLLPLPLLAISISIFTERTRSNTKAILTRFFFSSLFIALLAILIYILTNPYALLAYRDFRGSMDYESGVALGTIPVFYTGEFYETYPVLFQISKVLPFLLNPVLTILGILGFFLSCIITIRKKNPQLLLLVLILSVLFFPQSFFFVKWTRYMVPTIPFFILSGAFFLSWIQTTHAINRFSEILLKGTVLITCLFGISYFITAFVEPDTRIQAALTATKQIPKTAPILSETYDMGIVAFNEHFERISLFNFYDLDAPSSALAHTALSEQLTHASYLILPSQRLLATRNGNPQQFPNGHLFYSKLKNGSAQFQKIYETPCTIFCQITFLGNQSTRFEGTANSFDRPPVQIYQIQHNEQ